MVQRKFCNRNNLAVAASAFGAIMVFAAVLERVAFEYRVLPGITVAGIDASGFTEPRLRSTLDVRAGHIEQRVFRAHVGPVNLMATAGDLGVHVDVPTTVQAARYAGRSGNPIDSALGVVERRFTNEVVPLRLKLNERSLQAVAQSWVTVANTNVRNANIEVVGNEVRVTDATPGPGIRIDDTTNALRKAALAENDHDEATLTVTTQTIAPTISRAVAETVAASARRIISTDVTVTSGPHRFVITGAQIATSLRTEIRDAHLRLVIDRTRLRNAISPALAAFDTSATEASFRINDDESVSVIPSKAGFGPDLDLISAAILAGHNTITAPITRSEPVHNTAWAQSLGIKERVASFTTHHPCCLPRVTNIHMAAQYLDNAVIEAGKEFSLNNIVGARTAARGFVLAPVYYGEFTEDFGGGVSQLATTTFNAAFWGGFEIVSHMPHTIYFDRYPMGREATVNYPILDLKWRNNSHHGVLVKTYFSGTSITVALYGDRERKQVRETTAGCSVGPITDTAHDPRCLNILETIPTEPSELTCPVKNKTDDPANKCAALKSGERAAGASGHTGYRVEFFRTISVAGLPDIVEKFSWQYRMLPDIVLLGEGTTNTTTTTLVGGSTVPGATTSTQPQPQSSTTSNTGPTTTIHPPSTTLRGSTTT